MPKYTAQRTAAWWAEEHRVSQRHERCEDELHRRTQRKTKSERGRDTAQRFLRRKRDEERGDGDEEGLCRRRGEERKVGEQTCSPALILAGERVPGLRLCSRPNRLCHLRTFFGKPGSLQPSSHPRLNVVYTHDFSQDLNYFLENNLRFDRNEPEKAEDEKGDSALPRGNPSIVNLGSSYRRLLGAPVRLLLLEFKAYSFHLR